MRCRPARVSAALGLLREGFGDERRPLILFGAGHVGRALVLALAPLPFAVTWVDPRPDAFPAPCPDERHASAGSTIRPTALADAAAGTFVLVMTHSHPLDLALVGAALARRALPLCRPDRIGHQAGALREAAGRDGRARRPDRVAGLPDRRRRASIRRLPAVIAAATVAELLVRDEALRLAEAENGGLPVRRAAG